MKNSIIVIPSYWCKGELGNKDVIYDHPTDLVDPEETLSSTLRSLTNISGNFKVLVIGAPTKPDIGEEMDKKIRNLIEEMKLSYQTYYFGHKNFEDLKEFLKAKIPIVQSDILSNRGYSNIRNLCIFIPHLLDHDIAILIDDDEIITDPDFISKATEFIGKEINKKSLGLVVGFYKNSEGSIFVDESSLPWWELFWNKPKLMNEAFRIAENTLGERLIDVPFAFGGNMVISKDCWRKVPFDPLVRRGEDMDYLRNVKNSGFTVKLDKELFIVHVPPKSKSPYLFRLKEDIYRFIYAQSKNNYFNIENKEYYPYPGFFFDETEGKALLTELLYYIYNSQEELSKIRSLEELLENFKKINLISHDAVDFAKEFAGSYENFKNRWQELMKKVPVLQPDEVVSILN
ncbi:MAG: glycosyltransferase family 2 protein [Candidatus Hodarchaeales archaeon]|jgi:GT2 family glycosyltransferase